MVAARQIQAEKPEIWERMDRRPSEAALRRAKQQMESGSNGAQPSTTNSSQQLSVAGHELKDLGIGRRSGAYAGGKPSDQASQNRWDCWHAVQEVHVTALACVLM